MKVSYDQFQVGHWYRYTSNHRAHSWNSDGNMDYMLDGRARKCIRAGVRQQFEALPGESQDKESWVWFGSFEEVPEPVDPKKVTASTHNITFTTVDGRPSEPSLLSDIQQDLLRRL